MGRRVLRLRARPRRSRGAANVSCRGDDELAHLIGARTCRSSAAAGRLERGEPRVGSASARPSFKIRIAGILGTLRVVHHRAVARLPFGLRHRGLGAVSGSDGIHRGPCLGAHLDARCAIQRSSSGDAFTDFHPRHRHGNRVHRQRSQSAGRAGDSRRSGNPAGGTLARPAAAPRNPTAASRCWREAPEVSSTIFMRTSSNSGAWWRGHGQLVAVPSPSAGSVSGR